ncbi:hypothetical protein F5X99DRAFT_368788 [Biscogniauxia marginata]|nr:hypothetical protein F5X99DRAFT_368788 [Biscogniauxia marginata]
MSRPRVPSPSAIASVIFRALALVASVVLFSNVMYEGISWRSQGKIYWLSIVASLIAIIFDSFEVSALIDSTRTIPRISSIYLVCVDLAVLCLAGLSILLIFSSDWHRGESSSSNGRWPWTNPDKLSLGVTYFVCSFRCVLLAWSCVDYYKIRRPRHPAIIAPSSGQTSELRDITQTN